MTNKEKYGNKIIELAVNAGILALKMESLSFAEEQNAKSVIFTKKGQIRAEVVRIIFANGLILNTSQRLIGVRLQ